MPGKTPDRIIETDVLIVGAGIAGSAMAACLRYKPWRVTLVERSDHPLDTARGDHLQPYTAELFDRWGMLDAFWEAGARKRMGTLWQTADGDTALDGAVDMLPIPHPYYIYLDHEKIGETFLKLARQNPKFNLLRPALPKSFEKSGDGLDAVDVRLGDGELVRIEAKLIVGADGRGSAVREATGIVTDSYDYDNPLAIAFAPRLVDDPRRDLIAYIGDFGIVTVIPRSGGLLKVGIPADKPTVNFWKKASSQDLGAWFAQRVPSLEGLAPSQPAFYPVRMVTPRSWVSGNVVLLGDACHSMHPARGQGMNVGLRCIDSLMDGLNGLKDIGDRDALSRALQRYDTETGEGVRKMLAVNHQQGLEMDSLDPAQMAGFIAALRGVSSDPDKLFAMRMDAAGYPLGG